MTPANTTIQVVQESARRGGYKEVRGVRLKLVID
jgi:hypothetical protein